MDKAVILRRGLGLALVAPLATASWAGMTDPTQPPPTLAAPGVGASAAAPLTVTTVFLMDKRPHAIVDGLTVRVGDPLGDGRVSAIDERGVWLKTPSGKRLLRLVPDVDKKMRGQDKMEKKP
jgi:MSHA biogenesis protein MshK